MTILDEKPRALARLYKVEVTMTRELEIFVLADSREQAQEDADNLVGDIGEYEMGLPEWDTYARLARREPTRGEEVWTGGPDGEWRTWGKVLDDPHDI